MLTRPSACWDTLSDAHREALRQWLTEFEQSWDEGRLGVCVQDLPPAGSPLRLAALIEMVKIDLDRHWRRGQRKSVESYLTAYPELGTAETTPVDLIHAECDARLQAGEAVTATQLRLRFPRQVEELLRGIGSPPVRPTASSFSTVVPPQAKPPPPGPAAPPKDFDSLPERFGRYLIVKRLGKGGMGAVFLAHDTQLDRQVALKVPHFTAEDGPDLLARFFQEARAAATLRHPNICPVYDVGETLGIHYLTMAYIDGRPLSQVAGKDPQAQRPAAALVGKLALALHEAHQRGIVHRDLKPANVMVTPAGEPVLMDFGLARRLNQVGTRLTHTGALMGTPAYMAPEQAMGDIHAVGVASDIYSLGVILYELLTGRLPFEGSLAQMLACLIKDEPAPPSAHRSDLDPALEAVCRKAMAKNPAERFGTMAEFASALQAYLQEALPLPLQSHRPHPSDAVQALPRQDVQRVPPAPPVEESASAVAITEAVVFRGHAEPVLSVAFSPDGRRAATAGTDKTVRVWDVATGEELRRLDGHQGHVWAVAFSPDGRRILSGGYDQVLRLWNAADWQDLRRFKERAHWIVGVAFSPNGRQAASAGRDSTVRLWDVASGRELCRLEGHARGVTSVAFSPDGQSVLSGSRDQTVRLWDASAGRELRCFQGHAGEVTTVAFAPDGRRVASGSLDSTVRLWDIRSGEEVGRFLGGAEQITGVVFLPDGRRILAGGRDHLIRLWDVASSTERHCLEGHVQPVLAFAVSRDGLRALSGSEDGTARIWLLPR